MKCELLPWSRGILVIMWLSLQVVDIWYNCAVAASAPRHRAFVCCIEMNSQILYLCFSPRRERKKMKSIHAFLRWLNLELFLKVWVPSFWWILLHMIQATYWGGCETQSSWIMCVYIQPRTIDTMITGSHVTLTCSLVTVRSCDLHYSSQESPSGYVSAKCFCCLSNSQMWTVPASFGTWIICSLTLDSFPPYFPLPSYLSFFLCLLPDSGCVQGSCYRLPPLSLPTSTWVPLAHKSGLSSNIPCHETLSRPTPQIRLDLLF